MLTKEDFLELYSTISNSELLLILTNKRKYQPAAIEAANQELSRRQLTEEEIGEAKMVIEQNNTQKKKEKEKIEIFESKIRAGGKNILETLNPFTSEIPTNEKTIRLIVIVFGAISVYQLIHDYSYFSDIQYFYDYPLMTICILYPRIILPIAILTFAMRKQLGWILLASFLTYNTVWILRTFTKSYTTEIMFNFIPRESITSLLIQLLLNAGTLYVISKAGVRELFLINKSKMAVTIGITWFITFTLIFLAS